VVAGSSPVVLAVIWQGFTKILALFPAPIIGRR